MMERDDNSVTVETLSAWQGGAPAKVPLRDGMTLHDLVKSLHLPADTEAVMVNGVYVRPDYRLEKGDRVLVIPFMSGG